MEGKRLVSQELAQQLDRLEEKIDGLQDEVKDLNGGSQPDEQIHVSAGKTHGQSDVIKTLIKEMKKGDDYDGLEAGQVEALLQKEGHKRSRQAVLNLMRRLEQEYRPAKFKSGKSNKASQILWIP